MNKEDILKILEGAKDKNGEIPMRLVRQAFEKLSEPCGDTISRQAAIESIRECAEAAHSMHDWDMEQGYLNAIECIEEEPSAQPEIVLCKDCKYQVKEWRDDKRLKEKGYWVYGCKVISDICGYWAWFGQDDEFCSEAERRTDEQSD